MASWVKRTFYASLFALTACGSGGSSCNCAGVNPLTSPFPAEKRVENAASVRLTDAGFSFLSANLGPLATKLAPGTLVNGVFAQNIGPTSTKVIGITINICPNTPDPNDPQKCLVQADIGMSQLTLSATSPSNIHVAGTLNVKAPEITAEASCLFTDAKLHVELGENTGSCNPGDVQYTAVPITVDVPITTDTDPTHTSRYGLSHIGKIALNLNIDTGKIQICGDNICGSIFGGLAGFVKGLLVSQLTGPLQDQINNALCLKGNPMASPPCPDGMLTDPNDPASVCKYPDGTCVGSVLGTDGNLDLGRFLASLSPTTTGGLDFQFAVGGLDPNPQAPSIKYGDLNPVNGGATLSLIGGALPDPVANCVPLAQLTEPTGIPFPDEMLGNDIAGWPNGGKPHFGLALSERFLDYALGGAYNSGVLCVQLTTDQIPQLTAVAIVANSLKTLEWHKEQQPLGIILRPTKPPTLIVGNGTDLMKDPNLLIDLKALSLDFYIWSTDRYIRAFTYTADLSIPVNLSVDAMGLTPVLNTIGISNSSVTNAQLLKEDPKTITSTLDGVLGGVVGMFVGNLKPIDLNSLLKSLGLTLTIPPTVAGQGSPGLRKLSKDTDNFLGIFGELGIAPGPIMENKKSHTMVFQASRDVSPEGVRVRTMTRDNAPMFQVLATSSLDDGAHEIEYGYRIDGGAWHPWSTKSTIDVADGMLRLQGHHPVEVRSRVVGQPETESFVYAKTDLIIDADPPDVEVVQTDTHFEITAADFVTPTDLLMVRWALDDGAMGEWVSLRDLHPIAKNGARQIHVDVKDEDGHVGSTSSELRGRVDTTGQPPSSGCGCSVPGTKSSSLPLGGFAIAGVLAWMRIQQRRRRMREAAAGIAVLGVAATWGGCNCGSSSDTTDETQPQPGTGGHAGSKAGTGGAAGTGGSAGKAATGGAGGVHTGGMATGGTPSGGTSGNCDPATTCIELKPGLVGAYTSTAVAADGTIWVSGYNEADYDASRNYGDLVVGKYDPAKSAVAWKTVDGTDPTEMVDGTMFDTNGWRGGKTTSGDDVGLWTTTQLDATNNPMVAYYDATHGALKFAHFDGTKWAIHQVEQAAQASIGKYAKMVLVNKNPVIAYLAILGQPDGSVVSKVRIARAKSAIPAAAGDWTFEDVAVNPATPCRVKYCGTGTKCNSVSLKCEKPATSCNPACASGTDCFTDAMGAVACQKLFDSSKLDTYPEATGDYISAAVVKGEIALVYYDRLRGNLWQAQKTGGKWTPALLDGQTAGDPGMETGDDGVGASLFVDGKGDWHISYVDGVKEWVKYLLLPGGALAGAPIVVDKGGPAPGGDQFTDGQHIVGDDSNISVDAMGNVHIAYMDATAGRLRVATKTGGAQTFTVKEYITMDKFGGYFSQQVVAGGKTLIGHWWRVGGKSVNGDVAFLTP